MRLFRETLLLCSSVGNATNIVMDRHPSDFRKQSNLGSGILFGSRGTCNSCTLLLVSVAEYLVSESRSGHVGEFRFNVLQKNIPAELCSLHADIKQERRSYDTSLSIQLNPTYNAHDLWVRLEYLEFRDV